MQTPVGSQYMEFGGGYDVFCNVVGGLKLIDPSCDLGILVAVASNFNDRPCDNSTVVIGEVGLAGELRPVSQIERRIS